MLKPEWLTAIRARAKEFDAGAVWLFGSSLDPGKEGRDIDLAVEGIAPQLFFKFYGRLILDLPKPVDLVDLSLDPPIRHIVREKGVRIYER